MRVAKGIVRLRRRGEAGYTLAELVMVAAVMAVGKSGCL